MKLRGAVFGLLVVLASLAAVAFGLSSPELGLVPGGRYGPVRVALPQSAPRAFVVYFSDGRWQSDDRDVIDALAHKGAIAVGVDRSVYFSRLDPPKTGCDQLAGDAEALSRKLQQRVPGAEYLFPILAGRGESGALAGAIVEQATPRVLAGALTLDPTGSLSQPRALCPGGAAREIAPGQFSYGAKPQVNGFWTTGLTPALGLGSRQHLDRLVRDGMPIERVEFDQKIPMADAFSALLARSVKPQGNSALDAIPLIELPSRTPSDKLVIVLSGDGGWRDLDAVIAEKLQASGVNVVGWDSLGYFWRHKTASQTAHDLAATIDFYAARWHVTNVALVGYSFGANVLPAAYADLPPPTRAKVRQLSLLALAQRGDWQIQVSGWFGAEWGPDALPVAPDLARVPPGLIQCFYGTEDAVTACPSLASSEAEIIATPGGHHFDHDYSSLASRILAGFKRRSATIK